MKFKLLFLGAIVVISWRVFLHDSGPIQTENQQKQNSSSLQYEEEEEKEDIQCQRVGTQCRLRPGVLGVCLPGGFSGQQKLVCTPQH